MQEWDMTEESKKKTRKRSTEEQALWDEMERCKEAKRDATLRRDTHLSTLPTWKNESDTAIACAARLLIDDMETVEALSAKIAVTEAEYKKLRG
jgi:hypothetical protein